MSPVSPSWLYQLYDAQHTSSCPLLMQAWNLDKTAPSPGEFNIIVANNLSSNAQDLPSALKALYDSTEEGGFLFLQVPSLTLCVGMLHQEICQTQHPACGSRIL